MENDNDIVITGISGRFPECNNVDEFIDALFEGKDLLTVDDRRFLAGIWNTPKRMGKIPEPHKFDAAFFGIHPKLSNFMDPRHKIILETVYESIIDAGYNPAELRGSKTGVYSGMEHFTSMDEVRNYKSQGYANLGFAQALASNRVSYTFDFRGPSLTLDTACSSSLYALSVAVKDMILGEIDSAIISGAQLITHPHETLEFNNLNMLAADGKCKVFNANRDGYARAEAVVTIFLQKRSKARRIYSQIIGIKTSSDGYKPEGITYPNASQQLQLMQTLYDEIKLNPKDVTYIEAHGTGTPAGDIEECQGLATMFHNKTKPIPIGSVKSNMGHSECASGICALIKVLAIMEKKAIPASLHCDLIDKTLPGIKEGILKVVNKNEPWEEGLIALNCFGFGGANAHVVLKPHNKIKSIPESINKHRLVQVSGGSRDAVEKLLDEIELNRDEQLLALTDEIHKINIEGHQYRGYTVLNDVGTGTREIQKFSKARPIWFVYSGMGSQWIGMGKDLLKIPTFKSTFLRSAKVLEPYNIDLLDIVTSDSPTIFDNITNCFAAIGAIQVALTDVLLKFGIKPNGIAGHSLGEVCCCYADGLVTAEEATLLAFARGYACSNAKSLPEGQMAAIGLSKTEVVKLLPNDIYIACQNGSNSVTISGPKVSVINFVNQLQSKNIFAKLVKSADIAFHTKYISDAGDFLYNFVKKILKDPKPRTKRWISSSVSPEKSDEHWTQYNSAEYHTNNFCNTVLFDQVYEYIPENAIVIEIAPHGLLQPILKRELSSDATYISLANRSSADNELFLLSAIGKIFNAGGQPQLRNWYDEIQFPVSSGTKCLSSMVHWNHSEDWLSHFYQHKDYFGRTVKVNLGDEEYSYLVGHEIDGRVLMPATGYLELIWKVLSSLLLKNMENVPVIFEDVKFKRATVLSQNEEVTFLVTIMKQSGYFEIFEGGSVVVTGVIKVPKDVSKEFHEVLPPQHAKNQYLLMCEDDIYKECHLRRYNYSGDFKGLIECDVGGTRGRVAWKGRWDSFLDSMMHLVIIQGTKRDLRLPTTLRRLVIDPEMHLKMIDKNKNIDVFYNKNVQVIQSGAIQITGLETSKAPRRVQVSSPPNLETYKFVPYINLASLDLERTLTVALQIVIQNLDGTIKKMSIYEKEKQDKILDIVKEVLNRQPLLNFDYYTDNNLPNYDLVLLNENWNKVPEPKANFYLYVGNTDSDKFQDTETLFEASTSDNIKIVLLKTISAIPDKYTVINVRSTDFDWLEKIKIYSESDESRTIYLYSCNENNDGLFGLVKCLITEASHLSFKAVIIQDGTETFSMENPFYRNQLKKGLNFNVLNDGIWGTYVHLPLEPIDAKEISQASVDIGTVGDLSTLAWFQTPKQPKNKEIVNVHYGSLNFKDIMMATGRISSEGNYLTPVVPDVEIGLEYSGITATGRRVMGLLAYRSISLQAYSDPDFSWEVPSKWSLEDAATIPCVYATCYYALFVRGGIQRGSSILIHGGTGGVGLAAINIALGLNCQIFTTVGTQEKKNWLRETFPEIPEGNIGNSRNQSFEYLILERTQGKGVDFVLNSLAEDLFQASLRCVARRGCFLEIGKFDMMNSTMINSKLFLKNCTFHGVLLEDFFNDTSKTKRKIHELLEEGISSGVVKPLPRHVFTETELETAFRFLASGKHKGKVIIQIRPNETPLERTISANPVLYFDPDKSYIIVGGLGGFGLELADWMIKKGATKILLNSRRDISNGYQSYCFKKWSEYEHIVVKINLDDTTNVIGAERCVKVAEKLGGNLGGVFNLALVLRDNLIVNQTKQTFQEVFNSKIVSVQNLDRVTRKLGIYLDYFVAFSSIACGRGNNGQSNYGMANSAIEALCEKRMKDGLPALAVQWGPIGDVGALTRINTIGLMLQYVKLQSITSCLSCLEQFMLQSNPIVSSFIPADSSSMSENTNTKKSVALAVTHILGLKDPESVNKDSTLAQLGLDSLMLSEIKQTLYRNYQIDMSNEDIRNLTFTKLISMSKNNDNEVGNKSSGVKVEILNYISPKETLVNINSNGNNEKVLFLVHGIEGTINVLEPLASQLNRTIYGIQCSLNLTFESIKDLAQAYIRELKKTHQGPYVISGYSFGCAVAFEMGVELEKLGDKVELVLIDGSPNFVKQSLSSEYYNNNKSKEKCLNSILNTFIANFPEVSHAEAKIALATTTDIEIKFKKLAQLISDKTMLEPEIVATSARQFYQRCLSGFNYQPNGIFNGKITLIRTENNTILDSEDYDLQTICKEKVQVFKVGGTHRSMLTGEWLNNICSVINKLI